MNTQQYIDTGIKIKPKTPEDKDLLKLVAHSVKIANAMREPLWLGDRNHRCIYVNPYYEKLSGYTLKECIGKQSNFCFDEESKKTIAEHHKLRRKNRASRYEATIISKKGEHVPVIVNGAPTSSGGTIGIFTDQRKVKRLERQEKIAQQILKHSSEAIVILDKFRKVKLWSIGASRMFGYKEEDILNKCIDFVIPEESIEKNKNRQLIEEVENKNHIRNIEARRLAKNGEKIDVLVSITKVTDEEANFIGYLIIYQDITHQKRSDHELQKRFEAIQDAYKELGLQKRQIDYMNEIVSCATSKQSVETLEKLIVSAMCMLTKCDGAVLRKYNNKRNILTLRACFGVNQKWQSSKKISYKNSLIEEAFNKKRALIVDNIDKHPKEKNTNLIKTHKFQTAIVIPLMMNEVLIGSLKLYTTDPAKFRFIETDFLENMGKQCSLALHSKDCPL